MPRFLIVDDSPLDRLIAERLIRKSIPNVEIHIASSGEEALIVADAEPLDLILTDLNMPGMNGLELVEALKERGGHIPVVLMTGFGSEAIAVSALAAGAASYVPKQGMKRLLVQTLSNVLALAHLNHTRNRLLSSQVRAASTFVIDNDPTLVQPLINQIQEDMGRIQNTDDRDTTRVGVALHEALLNAIYHGNLEVSSDLRQTDESIFHGLVRDRRTAEPYCARRVFVTVDISSTEARFSIRDEGPGFDTKKVLDPHREIDFERIGGRGLLLISSFLDVVYHNAIGNEIHLVKYGDRSRQSAARVLQLQEQHA